MGLAKSKKGKGSSLKKTAGKVKGALGLSSKGKSGKSRKHGPTWYANKILIERMKKKLHKLKYGGR